MDRCLTADELTALELGESTTRAVGVLEKHLTDCPDCGRRMSTAQILERKLSNMDEIVGYEDGSSALKREIDGHVACFGEIDVPWGKVQAAVTSRGITRLEFDPSPDYMAAQLSKDGLIPEHSQSELESLARELDEYFAGERGSFDVPVDLRLSNSFRRGVLERTSQIRPGSFLTYQQVAVALGKPLAYRAVGNALGSNPIPIIIPCHRVLASGGGLGGFGGGLPTKRFLLELEGVMLAPRGRAALP